MGEMSLHRLSCGRLGCTQGFICESDCPTFQSFCISTFPPIAVFLSFILFKKSLSFYPNVISEKESNKLNNIQSKCYKVRDTFAFILPLNFLLRQTFKSKDTFPIVTFFCLQKKAVENFSFFPVFLFFLFEELEFFLGTLKSSHILRCLPSMREGAVRK